MKKNKATYIGLLLVLIFAVFVSFYYNSVLDNFEMREKQPRQKSCSSYPVNKCPSPYCTVIEDKTKCAGGVAPTSLTPGAKNYVVPSNSYMGGTCTGGYLKQCATKSLQ